MWKEETRCKSRDECARRTGWLRGCNEASPVLQATTEHPQALPAKACLHARVDDFDSNVADAAIIVNELGAIHLLQPREEEREKKKG